MTNIERLCKQTKERMECLEKQLDFNCIDEQIEFLCVEWAELTTKAICNRAYQYSQETHKALNNFYDTIHIGLLKPILSLHLFYSFLNWTAFVDNEED